MKTAVIVFVAVAALAVACAAEVNCKPVVTFPSNKKSYQFDLTPLSHAKGEPDTLHADDDDYNKYWVNFCGTTTEDCEGDYAVCQVTLSGDHFGCGTAASQKVEPNTESGVEPGKGLVVKYTNGKKCSGGPSRSTTIYLKCDENVESPIFSQVEEGDCAYTMHVTTKYACGKAGGASGAGDTAALVILIILICVVVIYFGGGVIYQKKFKDAQSARELVIHNAFWCALPGMVVDGCKFIAHGCKKGDYVSV